VIASAIRFWMLCARSSACFIRAGFGSTGRRESKSFVCEVAAMTESVAAGFGDGVRVSPD
jgi:hypothetical protein